MMFKPKRHLLDLSTTAVASFLATAVDGILFAHLLSWTPPWGVYHVGAVAALAAMVGGLTHFLLCRFWVFQRYDKPLMSALAAYGLMSGGAALAHGLTTHAMALYAGVSAAWLFSKVAIFVIWTYPVSRFVVFGPLGEEMN
ncbi:MAG: GtrA family protein [Bradymonadaceae bacterium]|nr:GtrA family protein [Lujinxingiaceae bacterium]